jgi:hypothetical protein
MKRFTFSSIAALGLLVAMTAPAVAADFPEQSNFQPCEIVQSLPFDFTAVIPSATAEKLAAMVADACNL